MLAVSESYIVSIDIDGTNTDLSCLSVSKVVGNQKLKVVHTLYGRHAELMYQKLTNNEIVEPAVKTVVDWEKRYTMGVDIGR